jgi:hypothetical protein
MTEKSPGEKAQHTAKWARIMTKWLITFNQHTGAKWRLVEFGGKTGSESRGIVDLLAIRKKHSHQGDGLKRGDLFEMILIQTKGGSARWPTDKDVDRLSKVAEHHGAKAVVLAQWRCGKKLDLFKLDGSAWQPSSPSDIFGEQRRGGADAP